MGTRIRNLGLADTRRLLVRDHTDSTKLVLSLSALSSYALVTTVWQVDSTKLVLSLCAQFSNVLIGYHRVAY